ncbi:MAG: hypothetical protein ACYC2Z_09600 [Candidatus Nanopelagicales bacterium]
MTVELVEPMPWSFTDSPGVLMWTWLTPHFVARITGTEVAGGEIDRRVVRSYAWDVSDLVRTSQGLPRTLVEGTASGFEEAELCVREHVGKCYDPRLGYRRFAGPLAFTFTLTTGERLDVSGYIGTRCTVTVLMPDRTERAVAGDFAVSHYKWRLVSGDQVIEILPEHVLRITNRSEAAERADAIVHGDLHSGIGRIYREDPRPGCTGRAGFLLGTVDHAGAPRCPLHEARVPQHLLR